MGSKGVSKFMNPDWIGKRFGKLTIVETLGKVNGNYMWRAKCDCGKITDARAAYIYKGHTTSCGCYKIEWSKLPRRHGMAGTRLYHIWVNMIMRCKEGGAGSEYYYDKGVRVCDAWKDFVNFYDWAIKTGYKDEGNLSIERIDVTGNYCPENCKWIERKYQPRNQRKTFWVEIDGRRVSLAEASEIAHLPYKTVFARIRQLGWPIDKALSIPINETMRWGKNERFTKLT